MSRRLEITMAANEGALIRVLGTVERRGYSLSTLHVEKTDNNMQVSMQIESDRDANILCRQLDRLFDVQSVNLEAQLEAVLDSAEFNETPRFQASWL
ncbi:MAG TPA: ACT domain-containing protein [Arenimonas sp.]|nr:ACT domain-containing protein [Arenimonas sp.]